MSPGQGRLCSCVTTHDAHQPWKAEYLSNAGALEVNWYLGPMLGPTSTMSVTVLNATSLSNRVHEKHLEGLSHKLLSTDLHSSLPGEFYCSSQIYQLERRAIFSRRWFLVSHKARYRKSGDYVQYEMGGYNFVVVKNKAERIVSFHNICR